MLDCFLTDWSIHACWSVLRGSVWRWGCRFSQIPPQILGSRGHREHAGSCRLVFLAASPKEPMWFPLPAASQWWRSVHRQTHHLGDCPLALSHSSGIHEWTNEWCSRPQFCTIRLHQARNNLGWWDEFWYEWCPRCSINHSTRWAAVQHASTVLQLPLDRSGTFKNLP